MHEIEKYISEIELNLGTTKYIKLIKTGKEAEVHLLEVNNKLMALKVYKQNIKYSSRGQYMETNEIGDKRLRRAAKNKTRVGIGAIKNSWVSREYSTLTKLYDYGALVPKPYMQFNQAILMEYLGDIRNPAPRLSEITIPEKDLNETYNIIIDHLNLFKYMGFAHGDFSEFNILWYKNLPYMIDFPQIVYQDNREFKSKLKKDIQNIERYFQKYRKTSILHI